MNASRISLIAVAAIAISGCTQSVLTTSMAQRTPADQSAFEVQALRSEMMVLATSCHDDRRYNAFIRRFRPSLQANERSMTAYFQTRGGQAAHDTFVTDLANEMSHRAVAQGASFCTHDGVLFTEAQATSPDGLAQFAASKSLVQSGVAR